MRKTALFASTLVLGLAGTASAEHWAADGTFHADCNDDAHLTVAAGYTGTYDDTSYDDTSYDDSYYDDSANYDQTTYPTTATYGDWVTTPVPAPQVVSVRARPGFVWIEGYWRWTGYEWSWVNGYWLRERPNYLYVQGRWDVNRGRNRWVSGYWKARPRVIIRDHRDDHRRNVRDRWDRRDRHDRNDRWDRRDNNRRDNRGWGGRDGGRRDHGRNDGGRDHRRGGRR